MARASRPTAEVANRLGWEYPGKVYSPVQRFATKGGAFGPDMSAAGTYELAPAAGETLIINRLGFTFYSSTGTWTPITIGSTPSAGLGWTISYRKDGAEVVEFTSEIMTHGKLVSNTTFFEFFSPDCRIDYYNGGAGQLVAGLDFVGSGAPIILNSTDDMIRIVADGQAGVSNFMCIGHGFLIQED